MKYTLLIFSFFYYLSSYCQCDTNLVLNGGFEDLYQCPENITGNYWELAENAMFWQTASYNTSDVFNICIPYVAINDGGGNVPDNYWGYQFPHRGDGYGGLAVICGAEASDYLQTPLSSSMAAGRPYELEFWLSSGDTSFTFETGVYCVLRGLEFLFTSDPVFWPDVTTMAGYEPQYSTGSVLLNDSLGWMHFKDTIILSSDAQYMTIGRWTPTPIGEACECFPGEFVSAVSYYYIDDIALRPIKSNENSYPNVFTPNGDSKNDHWYLPNYCGRIVIYNRWGAAVAELEQGESWNGRTSGEECVEGVYYFMSESSDGSMESGYIHLMR